MSKTPQEQVYEFHTTYGLPAPDYIHWPTIDRVQLRMELIREEMNELEEAVADPDGPIAEYRDKEPDLVGAVDALADIAYVVYGMAIEMGVDMDEIIEEVHRSNMSKLDADGKPIYREDGKVLKGPNYSPPDLRKVIERKIYKQA